MPIDTLTHTLNVAKTANWGDFEVMYDRIRVWLKRQCLRIASTKCLCVQRRQKQCIAFHLISLVVTVTWPARDFRPDRAIERSIGVGQVRRVVAYWNFFMTNNDVAVRLVQTNSLSVNSRRGHLVVNLRHF